MARSARQRALGNLAHLPARRLGAQTWNYPFGYSGHLFDVPESIRDYSVKGKYRIPVNSESQLSLALSAFLYCLD